MQQIIVNIVVAGAVLFLLNWLFRNFVSKRREEPSCGNCSCEKSPSASDSARHEGSARTHA